MKRFVCLAALLMSACGAEHEGAVMMIDRDYRLELAGTMADGFTAPDGLLWHDGTLLMADEAGIAIRSWRPGEQAVTLAGPEDGFSSPEDLVRDADGSLWFSDDNVGGLRRLDPDGRLTIVAGPEQGLVSTEGIALAPDGELIVGDGEEHRLFAITPAGEVRELLQAGTIAKPESMAFDGKGNLYIADNEDDVLYMLGADGELHVPLRGQADFSPESIAIAGDVLFITDSKNGRLWRYSPEMGLEAIAAFTAEFANVQGIATAPGGVLYVSIRAGPEDRRGYILKLIPRES